MSTATLSETITEESMHHHDASGSLVCIHSVCVHPQHRRQGIATKMLQAYIVQLKALKKAKAALIVHNYLVSLYASVGFKLLGVSPIVHGPDPWLDMELDLQ